MAAARKRAAAPRPRRPKAPAAVDAAAVAAEPMPGERVWPAGAIPYYIDVDGVRVRVSRHEYVAHQRRESRAQTVAALRSEQPTDDQADTPATDPKE